MLSTVASSCEAPDHVTPGIWQVYRACLQEDLYGSNPRGAAASSSHVTQMPLFLSYNQRRVHLCKVHDVCRLTPMPEK